MSRAGRQAARAGRHDESAYRAAHRLDPLPPSVWIVEHDGADHSAFAALRVHGPGQADLWTGGSVPPRPLRVDAVKRGRIRRRRLRLVDRHGGTAPTRLFVLATGERGMADVGHAPWLQFRATDLIDVLILLVALGAATPGAVRHRRARASAVRDIRAALQR